MTTPPPASATTNSIPDRANYWRIIPIPVNCLAGSLERIYDTHRNLLYALTAIEVDVLNPSTLQWQSPFTLPQPSTPVSYNVMALSPDGARLVISSGDGHVVVLNPDQPAQATLLTAALGLVSPSSTLVITKLDKAIFSGQPLTELDLGSLTFKPLNVRHGPIDSFFCGRSPSLWSGLESLRGHRLFD
jgi:hypothetical protein